MLLYALNCFSHFHLFELKKIGKLAYKKNTQYKERTTHLNTALLPCQYLHEINRKDCEETGLEKGGVVCLCFFLPISSSFVS